ncbi:VOC family protein [Patescibacteria group bacterium]|nr:VOC family protein [Patescibacteria group bacterium]MBU1754811.1 VOC family protein [Patescibacteria group bacterium]
MQKIIPHLWFDTEATEAAEFYVSAFKNSKITHSSVLPGTPSGNADIVSFDLNGYSFMAISAGPYFKLNPAISFMLNFDPSREEDAEGDLRALWDKLSDGGSALMPLQEYPFSKLYGWIKDKFGVTWQLMLTNPDGEERPFIIPSLMFTQEVNGKTQEATDFYIETFKNSKRGAIATYPAGSPGDMEGNVMFTDFQLEGQWFAAMDGGKAHEFTFNEGISLLVACDSQEEIDYYWDKLSAVPEAEQCGWLKDKYGLTWQINSTRMQEMLREGTPDQIKRVVNAFMPMKKFDLEVLETAYRGN